MTDITNFSEKGVVSMETKNVSLRNSLLGGRSIAILAFAVVVVFAAVPASNATIIADLVDNWHEAGGWPNNVFSDNASGTWTPMVKNDSGTVNSVLTADQWIHPVRMVNVEVFEWDNMPGKQSFPVFSEYSSDHIAAIPWNAAGVPGATEYRIYMIWTSGITGNVNVTGEFKFIGLEQSTVKITHNVAGNIMAETTLTPDNLSTPAINESLASFSININVTAGDQISFVIGTANDLYADIYKNETLFNATIEQVPEPATLALLTLGGMSVLLNNRKNRK